MDIAGKVFIVTGGASGLGEGTARMLAAHGATVLIADLQVEKGEALAIELGGAFVKCDVSQEADAQTAVDRAVGLGKLFGLVNCAGIAPAAKTVGKEGAHALQLFSKVITVNLIGSFNMIRLSAQAMSKNEPEPTGERGVLISTASVAAFDGQMGQAAYAASKGGVVGMTLPIARDLARNGIRNMTIAPGIFGTPMLFSMPKEVQDALAANVPFPSRLGTPQDYAKLVHQIITNEMLNGEVIRLDGAIRLAPKSVQEARPRSGLAALGVQHPQPRHVGRAVGPCDSLEGGLRLRPFASHQLSDAEVQLGIFRALQAALGNALLHHLQAARLVAGEHEVHAQHQQVVAIFRRSRLALVFELRGLGLTEPLGDQIAQPLVAVGFRTSAQCAGSEALVDHLLRL